MAIFWKEETGEVSKNM